MRPTVSTEVFASPEAKLFARCVQQFPPRRVASAILPSLIGVAAFIAGAMTIAALAAHP